MKSILCPGFPQCGCPIMARAQDRADLFQLLPPANVKIHLRIPLQIPIRATHLLHPAEEHPLGILQRIHRAGPDRGSMALPKMRHRTILGSFRTKCGGHDLEDLEFHRILSVLDPGADGETAVRHVAHHRSASFFIPEITLVRVHLHDHGECR